MNASQKNILKRFTGVVVITVIAVIAIMNLKVWVNRSEAMRAMEHLGQIVIEYRKEQGAVPPESDVLKTIESLPGQVRLGQFRYRALWIDFESTPEEILAYAERNYKSLLMGKGYIVLRLSGSVEWMDSDEFQLLLSQQQGPDEIRALKN